MDVLIWTFKGMNLVIAVVGMVFGRRTQDGSVIDNWITCQLPNNNRNSM